jgi:uncharacterized membrane protein YccC
MKSDKPLGDKHRQMQDAILQGMKDFPLRERLAQGCVIALLATCSACIAYSIGFFVHPQQAVWAAMTAIAVTQHSYSDTMHLSRDQFMGAMVGGLSGFVGASFGSTDHLIAYAITVPCAMILCWSLNAGSAARLSGVTATIVLLFPGNGPLWDVPLLRLVEVTIGTLCSMSISWAMSEVESHRNKAPKID